MANRALRHITGILIRSVDIGKVVGISNNLRSSNPLRWAKRHFCETIFTSLFLSVIYV